MVSNREKDVKMWHVGVHIWEVNPNEIEPNYDEYYGVGNIALQSYDNPDWLRSSWRSISSTFPSSRS